MTTNKILGYILVIAGLLLIVFVVWQAYNVFTNRASAPLLFKSTPMSTEKVATQDIQGQINEAVKKQIGQLISPEDITKILNLISWSLLLWILIIAGGTLSGIGVKLVK